MIHKGVSPFGKSEILPDGLICRITSGWPKGTGVIARLDRATQYSRDAEDRAEKPQRTGSPAFAGDDD
jgi:hypothetical protein